MSEEKVPWYDTKRGIRLSLLFPPLFIYGIYKTNTMTKGHKWFALGLVSFIAFGTFVMDDKDWEMNSVKQSSWDNSVDVVEHYIKHDYLSDPDSYQSVKWSKLAKNVDGTYVVMHTYRAKNGFGGYVTETKTFIISSDGKNVVSVY